MFVIAILTLALGGFAKIVWPTYKIFIEVAQILIMAWGITVVKRQITKHLEVKRLEMEQEELRRQRRNERQRERRERVRALRRTEELEARATLNSHPLQERVSELLRSGQRGQDQNAQPRPQVRKTVPKKLVVQKPTPPPPKSRLDRLLEQDEDEVSRS